MNAPRKNNDSQKSSSRNSIVSSMILSILDTLKKKPENKWKDNFEILKEFLNDYRIDWDKWLLEELSKQWNISFDMIKDDGFDIGQIIWDDRNTSASTLHNILNSAQMWELGKNIEKVAINKLIEDIKNKIPNVLKPSFETETNNTKTLWDFKRDIWNFIEYWNGWKAIDEKLVKEIKNIKIENKDIVDGLVKEGKLAANDIRWDYKNRNNNNKKTFDKFITQEYLDWLREEVNYMEKNLNMLKDTFTNFVPNMWWIIDKYPWNKGEIDSEILQKINDAQESWDKQTSDRLSFDAYIQLIKRKNNNLWDILSKLFQNNFDFGKLSNEDQNNFLKESVSARLESLKANNIADLLEIDQGAFDKFVKDIFDLNQKEIIIPSAWGDIKLWVNKKLKWWENPNLVDLSNFTDAKLPIELDIKILDDNKDLLNNTALKYVFADNISEDWNNIKLDWNNIGKLILLYAVWEASFDNKDMSPKKVKELEKLFDLIDKKTELNNKEIFEKSDDERNNLISNNSKEDNELFRRQRHYVANENELRINWSLDDKQRLLKAKEKINLEWKEYNDPEEKFWENSNKANAILNAHNSTVYDNINEVPNNMKDKVELIEWKYYEIWKDWKTIAWLLNYTNEQIKKKIDILKKSWFNSWQVKILLQDWFCGKIWEKIEIEAAAAKILKEIEKWRGIWEEEITEKAYKYYKWLNKQESKDIFTDKLESKLSYLASLVPPKDIFTKNLIDTLKNSNQEDKEEEKNKKEEKKESKETPQDEFLNKWKNIKWYEFVEDKINFGFKEGTRLRVRLWDTELPPANIWWDMRMQLEITHAGDRDFKVKLTWWEKSAGSYEWKELTCVRNKEDKQIWEIDLDDLIGTFNGEVYKLPPPNEWGKSLDNVKNGNLINIKDGVWVFDEIKYENWKFISNIEKDDKNNWKEISYFGTDEITYDDNWKEEKKPIFYKISHNNWKITVEYQNYKREMDYNNFIIFVSTKSLKPATKEHAEETTQNYDKEAKASMWWRKLQFFGISNIFSSITGMWKKINEAVKKYGEEKTEKFNDFLVGDVGIFQKLTSITSWIPWVWEAIQWVQLDYYNERDAKTRKKIDKWIKIFEWDPDFGDSFWKNWYLRPYLWDSSLQDMVVNWKQPKDPYIAAASLIALISKGSSPYRNIQWLKMKWARVKLLLWETHQKRFFEFQKDLIREIENNKWLYGSGYDAQMTNDLVRAEMTYLINNIWDRAPWQRFGSAWPEWKAMRSDKFAWELESKYNERVSQWKIEDKFNGLKQVTNFTFCYNEFKRFSASGRSQHALAFLKKMATLAKSPQQISILKMAILSWMLNWFFLNFADKDTKWWLQSICRSMWFAPWLRVTTYEQKEKTAHMLDYITKGNFSSYMKYNPNNFGLNSNNIDYKTFLWGDSKNKDIPFFEKWWNQWNGETVSKFLKELPKMEIKDDDSIIIWLKKLSIESQVEWTDKDVDTNSKIITDSPLSQTKGLVQQKMLKYDNWIFNWDVDQIQAAEDFWDGVSKNIHKWNISREELKSMLNIFLNRFSKTFDENWKSDLVRRISTVKRYNNKMISVNWKKYVQQDWGKLSESDIKNVLWYSVVGEITESERSSPPSQLKSALEAFYNLFQDNIDKFDEDMISSVFGPQYKEEFSKPYYLAPWDEYDDIIKNYSWLWLFQTEEERMLEEAEAESGLTKNQKEERKKKKAYYNNEDIFLNKKLKKLEVNLSRKWVTWHPLWRSIKDISRGKERLAWNT